MTMVTLGVATLDETKARLRNAFKGKKQGAYISFATVELLFRVMTTKRWQLLQIMTGAGPLSIREVARRLDRDVKAVHSDVHGLLNAGVLEKTDDGVVFPYDAVHIDVTLRSTYHEAAA
jgi:predicted transcriptional regulator